MHGIAVGALMAKADAAMAAARWAAATDIAARLAARVAGLAEAHEHGTAVGRRGLGVNNFSSPRSVPCNGVAAEPWRRPAVAATCRGR